MELLEKLQSIRDRFYYLEELLADPEVIADNSRYAKVNKEYSDLTPLIEAHKEYSELLGNIQTAREMMGDPEMKDMAQEELDVLEPRREEIEEDICDMVDKRFCEIYGRDRRGG